MISADWYNGGSDGCISGVALHAPYELPEMRFCFRHSRSLPRLNALENNSSHCDFKWNSFLRRIHIVFARFNLTTQIPLVTTYPAEASNPLSIIITAGAPYCPGIFSLLPRSSRRSGWTAPRTAETASRAAPCPVMTAFSPRPGPAIALILPGVSRQRGRKRRKAHADACTCG